jgi:hypothetical protein
MRRWAEDAMKSEPGSPLKLGGAAAAGVRPAPLLTVFPPYLDHLVPDLDLIPMQPPRDLLHRQTAHEHVAQRVQLPPLDHSLPAFSAAGSTSATAPCGSIQDRGTDHAQQRFALGILRAAEECTESSISVT